MKKFTNAYKSLPYPGHMIYLDVTPENCYDRMINIRKRECEKNVPLAYL